MSIDNLTTELLEKIRASIHSIASLRRTFLNEVITLVLYTVNGRGPIAALLTLAVLIAFTAPQPSPTPTPIPLPI
jgi:hypothetical protein